MDPIPSGYPLSHPSARRGLAAGYDRGGRRRLYVMKFVGAGQGPKALIAELVAGEIGRALGLRVPEIVLMSSTGRWPPEPDPEIRLTTGQRRPQPGPALSTQGLRLQPVAAPAPDRPGLRHRLVRCLCDQRGPHPAQVNLLSGRATVAHRPRRGHVLPPHTLRSLRVFRRTAKTRFL